MTSKIEQLAAEALAGPFFGDEPCDCRECVMGRWVAKVAPLIEALRMAVDDNNAPVSYIDEAVMDLLAATAEAQ